MFDKSVGLCKWFLVKGLRRLESAIIFWRLELKTITGMNPELPLRT